MNGSGSPSDGTCTQTQELGRPPWLHHSRIHQVPLRPAEAARLLELQPILRYQENDRISGMLLCKVIILHLQSAPLQSYDRIFKVLLYKVIIMS